MISDASLAAVRRGDAVALERLVRQLTPPLLRLARRIVRDEAQARDAVAEGFDRARKCGWRFQGRPEPFLRAAVAAGAVERARRASARALPVEQLLPRFLEDGHHESHPPDWSAAAAPGAATRALALGAFERLPGDERALLVLRDVAELSNHEAAARLGLDEETAKRGLRRARQALRALIEPRLRSDVL